MGQELMHLHRDSHHVKWLDSILKASESGKIDCNVALIGFMGTGKNNIQCLIKNNRF
ncbi:MAG: hypothetical protein ACLUR5_02500 [Eubacterium ventriosum]